MSNRPERFVEYALAFEQVLQSDEGERLEPFFCETVAMGERRSPATRSGAAATRRVAVPCDGIDRIGVAATFRSPWRATLARRAFRRGGAAPWRPEVRRYEESEDGK